jgi:DNA-binding response OmpR family regulator
MQTPNDILIVDDEPPIVQFIAEVLIEEGYTVRTAFNAQDARTVIAERHPDLVLVDLTMPGQGGHVLARELKDDGLTDIPIVLMTADSRAAKELSMDGIAYCLMKPFDLDELIDCVAKHIRRADRAAA